MIGGVGGWKANPAASTRQRGSVLQPGLSGCACRECIRKAGAMTSGVWCPPVGQVLSLLRYSGGGDKTGFPNYYAPAGQFGLGNPHAAARASAANSGSSPGQRPPWRRWHVPARARSASGRTARGDGGARLDDHRAAGRAPVWNTDGYMHYYSQGSACSRTCETPGHPSDRRAHRQGAAESLPQHGRARRAEGQTGRAMSRSGSSSRRA